MKDEIKEILDYFKKYVNDKYETYTVVDIHTQNLRTLLYYITNLQTIEQQYSAILSENAELENKITNLQEENERLSVELNQNMIERNNYLSRNEKAIEFLEHFDSGQQCEHTKDLAIIVENILQGEDKDE